MKATILSLFLALSAVCFAQAQTYEIDWYTIDNGGGTSTGGVYAVIGTIGQPDAGRLSGGNFELVGGFWGIVAPIQTPDGPYLTARRTGQAVIVSWLMPGDGWVLQRTDSLPNGSTTWVEIAQPYQVKEDTFYVTETLPTGNRFYRLHKR